MFSENKKRLFVYNSHNLWNHFDNFPPLHSQPNYANQKHSTPTTTSTLPGSISQVAPKVLNNECTSSPSPAPALPGFAHWTTTLLAQFMTIIPNPTRFLTIFFGGGCGGGAKQEEGTERERTAENEFKFRGHFPQQQLAGNLSLSLSLSREWDILTLINHNRM